MSKNGGGGFPSQRAGEIERGKVRQHGASRRFKSTTSSRSNTRGNNWRMAQQAQREKFQRDLGRTRHSPMGVKSEFGCMTGSSSSWSSADAGCCRFLTQARQGRARIPEVAAAAPGKRAVIPYIAASDARRITVPS